MFYFVFLIYQLTLFPISSHMVALLHRSAFIAVSLSVPFDVQVQIYMQWTWSKAGVLKTGSLRLEGLRPCPESAVCRLVLLPSSSVKATNRSGLS